MRPHERRRERAYPYYKLAVWDPVSFTWRDGKKAFATEAEAVASAVQLGGRGRFRVSVVSESSRVDLAPFEVQQDTTTV